MEHVEHFVEAEPLVAEEVVDGEAARRRPLNADGEVRRLLYLYEEASRSYRVRHAAFDEYRVAGFDVEAFERVEHAVEVLLVEELFPALARDASLEAERAGEFGEGFALVSSEIGRLADRSALSAMRVSKMVSRMRESVESGLSEMELFSTQMRESLRTIKMLSESLDAAKAQVAELGAEFDSLAHGVSAQSESAIKISVSVHELNSAAFQTRNKAGDLKIVTDALEKTSFELKAKVSQFKLPPDNKGA